MSYREFDESLNRKGVLEMLLYHASKEEVEFPEVRKTKYTKDFSWGFYCTNSYEQAVRWANRGKGVPVINTYNYVQDSTLAILKFEAMTDEWLDFIAKCRQGNLHRFDIVEGPMADDTVWNYVNDFLAGEMTREQFWSFAKFKYPIHQISFHTLSALNCLVFEGSEVVYDG